MVRGSFSERGVSHTGIQGRGHCKHGSLEEAYWMSKNSKEARVFGTEWVKERMGEEKYQRENTVVKIRWYRIR